MIELRTPAEIDAMRPAGRFVAEVLATLRDEEQPTGTVQTGNAASGGLFSRLRDAFNS
jgi:hypothetical protein